MGTKGDLEMQWKHDEYLGNPIQNKAAHVTTPVWMDVLHIDYWTCEYPVKFTSNVCQYVHQNRF